MNVNTLNITSYSNNTDYNVQNDRIDAVSNLHTSRSMEIGFFEKMPNYIIEKIIFEAGVEAERKMAQTCKKVNQIVVKSERLHRTQTAFQLLQQSYQLGMSLKHHVYFSNFQPFSELLDEHEPDIILDRDFGKWLAEVSSSLLRLGVKDGLGIADQAVACSKKGHFYGAISSTIAKEKSLEVAHIGEDIKKALDKQPVYLSAILPYAAYAYTLTNPLKSMEIVQIMISPMHLSRNALHCADIVSACARHMIRQDEQVIASLKKSITEFLGNDRVPSGTKIQILKEFIPAQDTHNSAQLLSLQTEEEIQALLTENQKLLELVKSYAAYPVFQTKVLSTIAMNRAQFNLDKRSQIMNTTVENVKNIGRKHLNFDRVKEVLDMMTNSFTKAQCLAMVADTLIG